MNLPPDKAAFALKLWLRIVAASMMLAIVAVIQPTAWLEKAVKSLIPDAEVTLLTQYLSRTLSMFYFMLGGLFWIFAGDIKRYFKAIHFLSYCYVLASIIGLSTLVIIQATLGNLDNWLFYFIVIDFIFSIAMAISVLILLYRSYANLE